MGVVSTNGANAEFTSRMRVSFAASGESDNGLTFGGSMRADNSVAAAAGTAGSVFISGAFGKLAMGDVAGAADALVGQVSGVGLTSIGTLNEIGFLANTTPAVLYTYSAGALSFGIGAGQSGSNDMSVAAKYSTDAYSVAVGYEDNGTATQTSALASATMSGATVKAKLVNNSAEANSAYAMSVDYGMGDVSMTAFYASSFSQVGSVGVGASYSLGGGATVIGGVSKAEGAQLSFDLGVSMSF